jgi:multiple sugar transport system substrate-binding protein
MSTFFPPSFIAHFDAGGTDSATYAGIEYGLQVLGANDTALVYNKADFAQAGITSPPKTWSQLLTDATKLTVPSQNRYGFGVSGTQTEESSWQFEPFLWSNGGNLDDLNSPASVKALSFWQELVKDKVMPSATASWTQADVQDHFAVNDLAMEINGPWQVPCLEVPSVCLGSAKSSVKPVPWGVAPIPTRLTSQKLIVPIGGETWEIGKSTTAQEAASALLIQFLTDDTALNVAVTHTMGYMPAIKTETAAYDRSFPLYSAWASELRNGIPREYGKGQYGAVSALLQVAIGQVLTLSESPQAALNTAAAGVKAIPTS